MDSQQVKILLEKINSLYKSINLNNGPMVAIERDLMLSYIRQLYEEFLEADAPKQSAQSLPNIVEEDIKQAPPKEADSPKPTYDPPKVTETPPYTPPPKVETPRETPTPPPPPRKSGNYEVLFDQKQAKELSEKLSERPITDLTKAFAINDKLLYINELFGRDNESFNETLKLLNRFESMSEAKSLLLSVAEQYDWLDEERQEIAQSFIKTVRRRYNGQ
jgi:hypothetical protein